MFKKKDAFLEALYQIAVNVHESAQFFQTFDFDSTDGVASFFEKMKELEHKGDIQIHDIITGLNKVFITEIERDDILKLALTLDDVLDGMEACSSRLYMYDVTKADSFMIEFAKNIVESTQEILHAVSLLREKKLLQMREHVININSLESVGDQLLRTSVRSLFLENPDPIQLIKFKEIYEILESVSDSCEDVANTLESIIMKNS